LTSTGHCTGNITETGAVALARKLSLSKFKGTNSWFPYFFVAVTRFRKYEVSMSDRGGVIMAKKSITSFIFSTDGQSVFILDTVHQQIMGIDATGKAKVIAKNVAGWAICADGSGGAFVQDEKRIMHFDGNGTLKSHFGIEEKEGAPVKMVQGYGMDMFLDSGGYLCVRELDQNVHRVSGAPRMSTFSSESSTDSAESLRYKIKRLAGNEVRIIGLDPYGKVLVSVPIRLDSGQPGAVLFKGIDAQGNLYVELENLKRNNVELEAHRYSQSGERLGVLHLPNDYFTTVYKKTELARDGSVYQMLTTPEGVKILRWKF
jgi:hypothetical protein